MLNVDVTVISKDYFYATYMLSRDELKSQEFYSFLFKLRISKVSAKM